MCLVRSRRRLQLVGCQANCTAAICLSVKPRLGEDAENGGTENAVLNRRSEKCRTTVYGTLNVLEHRACAKYIK